MALIYLDTGVVLALAQGTDRWFAAAKALFASPAARFAVSDMVWLEVWPSTHGPQGRALRSVYEAVFATSALVIAVDDRVVKKAKQLAAQQPVKGADAIHAAAALLGGARDFVTTEGPTKPLHKVLPPHGVRVRQLAPGA